MIVHSFGLHVASGIPFLLQANGATNLISADLKSPFQLHITPKRTRCPNEIDLSTYVEAPEWINDPLASAYLPLPLTSQRSRAKIILDPDQKYAGMHAQLVRLLSATGPIGTPLWANNFTDRNLYVGSNLGPVVFFGVDNSCSKFVFNHLKFSIIYDRSLLFYTREPIPVFPPDVEWIKSSLNPSDLLDQPLEAIGSGILRRYMDEIS